MSRTRLERRQRKKSAAAETKSPPAAIEQAPVSRAAWWLAAAFLIPNLGALACGFVFDDRILIVENTSLHLHSLAQLAHIWRSGYWPDSRGLELYRPVAQTLWALVWRAGGGAHPWMFHAVGLALGLGVVLLVYRFLLVVETPPRTAFVATLLFALFPIHTEATTSVVGSAELLAAAFGLGALICYERARPLLALLLFAGAVFSKESAAAFAAVPLIFPRKRDHSNPVALAAAAIIGAALLAHRALSHSSAIPAIDNPMALVGAGPRLLTALWVQCLYLAKTLVPVTLSADYSYHQIPLVMDLSFWRAWVGLALAAAALYLVIRRRDLRPAALIYIVLFSPTANFLFPIGTIMGERLSYAPSIGVALLLAIFLVRTRYWKPVLMAVAIAFAARTAVRNLDWLNPQRFYSKLVETSPMSAKSHYSTGVLRAASGDDRGAIEAYDRAIAIFPAYSEAFRNRGNSLARLGRREEAMASYRQCLRFDPGDYAAAFNLSRLQAGLPVNPPRAHP